MGSTKPKNLKIYGLNWKAVLAPYTSLKIITTEKLQLNYIGFFRIKSMAHDKQIQFRREDIIWNRKEIGFNVNLQLI